MIIFALPYYELGHLGVGQQAVAQLPALLFARSADAVAATDSVLVLRLRSERGRWDDVEALAVLPLERNRRGLEGGDDEALDGRIPGLRGSPGSEIRI